MRTAITIARRHDGKTVIVSGPEVPIDQQTERIQSALGFDGIHPDFSRLEFWTSNGGRQVALDFVAPEQALA